MDIEIIALLDGITILTGRRGSGKTAACQKWVEQAHRSGWKVSGVLSPAVFENGEKTAIDVVILQSGERRRLANRVTRQTGFDVTDHWDFSQDVISWSNEALSDHSPVDLFVVDELGPLEFYRHEGWMNAFQALRRGFFRHAVVVIRPELMEEARQLWTDAYWIDIDA